MQSVPVVDGKYEEMQSQSGPFAKHVGPLVPSMRVLESQSLSPQASGTLTTSLVNTFFTTLLLNLSFVVAVPIYQFQTSYPHCFVMSNQLFNI